MSSRRVKLNDCERMTVRDAREEARKLLASMGLGIDPITERKAVELASMTLRRALTDRIAVRQLKPGTGRDYIAIAERSFADWMDRPLSTITAQMAIDRHRQLTARGPVQANYAMRILSSAFGHARGGHGLQAPNPVSRMREGKLFNKVRPRDGYVEPHDLPVMLSVLRRMELARLERDRAEQDAARDAGLSWQGWRSRIAQQRAERAPEGKQMLHYAGAADLVRLLLLTGFRLNEAQHLEWSSVDLERRLMVLTENKASRTLRMPLCGALVAILKRRADAARLSDGTMPRHVFQWGDGPYTELASRVMPMLSKAVGAELRKGFHAHAHLLRHSFATYLRAMGHSEFVVAGLLNHSRNSITAIYAAPITNTQHRIVDELQGWIESLLADAPYPAHELLTGCADKAHRSSLLAVA
jgi:integrase